MDACVEKEGIIGGGAYSFGHSNASACTELDTVCLDEEPSAFGLYVANRVREDPAVKYCPTYSGEVDDVPSRQQRHWHTDPVKPNNGWNRWSRIMASKILLIISLGALVTILVAVALVISRALVPKEPTMATTTHRQLLLNCPEFPEPTPLVGKKGTAFPLREEGKKGSWTENLPKIISLNPHWHYSWSHKRHPLLPQNIEFASMIWGGAKPEKFQARLDEVAAQIASGEVKHVLGFNEPDKLKQANMPVERALSLWPQLEQLNATLVSPVTVRPQNEWMTSFMSGVDEGCKRTDWVSVHWYGTADFKGFKYHLRQWHQLYGRPILVSEFACADWFAGVYRKNRVKAEDVLQFMKDALPWMERTDWIVGYAWFPFDIDYVVGTTSALFDREGELTDLGRFYASVRTNRPNGDQGIGVSPTQRPTASPTRFYETLDCPRYPTPRPFEGKKGAVFSSDESLTKLINIRPYWSYNWSANRTKDQPDEIEFVPMIATPTSSEDLSGQLDSVMAQVQTGLAKRVLGFDVPELQKDTEEIFGVGDALELLPSLEALGVPLVSPGSPDNKWTHSFMYNASNSCFRTDWIAVQWYGPPNFDDFRREITANYKAYGRPLLLTEFSCVDFAATSLANNRYPPIEVLKFMQLAIPWLETQSWVVGYSWVSFDVAVAIGTSSALYNENGRLTDCGKYYRSVRTNRPRGDQKLGLPTPAPTLSKSAIDWSMNPTMGPTTTAPTRSPSTMAPSTPPSTAPPSLVPTLAPSQLQCKDIYAAEPLSGKRGVALTLNDDGPGSWMMNIPKLLLLNPHWNYSWGQKRVDAQPDHIEFVPQVEFHNPDFLQSLQTDLLPHIQSGSVKRVLGFHNPDRGGLKVVDAVGKYWPDMESLGVPLVSPSCSSLPSPWMTEFMESASGRCSRIDWIGVHWYGDPHVDSFKNKMVSLFDEFKRPLLITEFAVVDWEADTVESNRFSEGDVLAFMEEILPWLESQDWIAGYAWYSYDPSVPRGTTSALFDHEGSLTNPGLYYRSVNANIAPTSYPTLGPHSMNPTIGPTTTAPTRSPSTMAPTTYPSTAPPSLATTLAPVRSRGGLDRMWQLLRKLRYLNSIGVLRL